MGIETAAILIITATLKAAAAAVIQTIIADTLIQLTIIAIVNAVIPIVVTIAVKLAIAVLLNAVITALLPGQEAPDFAAPKVGYSVAEIPEVQTAHSSDGAKMWRGYGRRGRIAGTIIWAQEPIHYTEDVALDGIETTVDRYKANFAVAWGQSFAGTDGIGRVSDIIAVMASGKVIWKKNKNSKYDHRWKSWQNYNGGASQSKDSFLQGKLGNNKVSAFRNTALSVIEELRLEDIGGAIPQILEAIVEWDSGTPTLPGAVTAIWNRRPGASASTELDLTKLTGRNTIADTGGGTYPFQGVQYEGPKPISEMLEDLEIAYDLTIRHNGSKLQIMDRGSEDVIPIVQGHLGCAEGLADSRRPITVLEVEPRKQPSAVIVQYRAKNHGYQRATEDYPIANAPPGENKAQWEYPGVLLPKEARRIAKRRAIEAYRVGKEVSGITLPPDYMDALCGDLIPVTLEGQNYYVRIQQITRGANEVIEIDGVVEQVRGSEDEIIVSSDGELGANEDDDPSNDDDPLIDDPEEDDVDGYLPSTLRVAPMNLPPLFKDAHAKTSGIYYAHAPEDPLATWKGAKAYRSWKASGGYSIMSSALAESDMGIALEEMPDSSAARLQILDTATRLRVQMFRGAPVSRVRSDVESGMNWVAIGDASENRWEICAFLDAEPEDEQEFDLTSTGLNIISAYQLGKSGGTSFVTMGITDGAWVRVRGFSANGENVDFFRRVETVAANLLEFDPAGEPLVEEGPLASGVAASIATNSGVYVLSNWFRGMRDTSDHAGEHVVGDLVVFLDGATNFEPMPKAKIGKKAKFKSVPKGQTLGDVNPHELKYVAETLRPFRPCWFLWKRTFVDMDGDDPRHDLEISWVHRSRFPFPDPTTSQVPPHELDAEGKTHHYKVKIYSDSDRTTLVRSFDVDGVLDDHEPGESPQRVTKAYTVAQQEADGVLGDPLWLTIWQVGAIVPDGNQLFAEIPGV